MYSKSTRAQQHNAGNGGLQGVRNLGGRRGSVAFITGDGDGNTVVLLVMASARTRSSAGLL